MRIAVVVLHFRNWPGIRATLDSLLAQGIAAADVTVVDNASGDGSVEQLKRNYPGMSYIERNVNGGYAAGMNEGIRSCMQSCDAVLLVTHDCVLADHGLAVCAIACSRSTRWCGRSMLAWRSRPQRITAPVGLVIDADTQQATVPAAER